MCSGITRKRPIRLQTVLTPVQEAIVIHLRHVLMLALDDLLTVGLLSTTASLGLTSPMSGIGIYGHSFPKPEGQKSA